MTLSVTLYYKDNSRYRLPQQNDSERTLPDWERYKEISVIKYNYTIYPLKETITGCCKPSNVVNAPYRYEADVFSPPLCGDGLTKDEARKNWEQQFHETFQKIYTKLDWERTEEEIKFWKVVEGIVDISEYRKLTPLKFQQTGKIIRRISSDQCEIEWIGNQRDIVNYVENSPELSQYEIEKYFCAEVLREYQTDKLIKICSVFDSDHQDYTHEELDEIINSLPTTNDFPVSTLW